MASDSLKSYSLVKSCQVSWRFDQHLKGVGVEAHACRLVFSVGSRPCSLQAA